MIVVIGNVVEFKVSLTVGLRGPVIAGHWIYNLHGGAGNGRAGRI